MYSEIKLIFNAYTLAGRDLGFREGGVGVEIGVRK